MICLLYLEGGSTLDGHISARTKTSLLRNCYLGKCSFNLQRGSIVRQVEDQSANATSPRFHPPPSHEKWATLLLFHNFATYRAAYNTIFAIFIICCNVTVTSVMEFAAKPAILHAPSTWARDGLWKAGVHFFLQGARTSD